MVAIFLSLSVFRYFK